MIDTFMDWMETFPTTSKGASKVTKALLQSIVLRFGLPVYRVMVASLYFLNYSAGGTSFGDDL
jgi:hypothetical protein